MDAIARVLTGLATITVLCASGAPASAAEPAASAGERRPDAAQAVQEGNVDQWVQHYQRERGHEWERARQRPEPVAPGAAGAQETDASGVPAQSPENDGSSAR